MLDRANRRIRYLRISITDRCNLRCVYCMPEEGVPHIGHAEVLSYEEILRIVRVMAGKGITKVRLTGGEPLVRRGVAGLVRDMAAVDGIQDLSLTTNGVLLASMADELRDAGVGRINVSLDSLDPDRFRRITRGGELRAVLDGLDAAGEAGFSPIKLNVVPIRGLNDDEVERFAALTIDKPYHVRFIEFMPIGARAMWDESKVVSSAEVRESMAGLGALEAVESGVDDGPALLYRLPGAAGVIGFISPLTDHFCGLCNRLRLTADGRLRPCLFSDDEVDLKAPMRAGCTDERICALVDAALDSKPDGHGIAAGYKKKYKRTMSRIGG